MKEANNQANGAVDMAALQEAVQATIDRIAADDADAERIQQAIRRSAAAAEVAQELQASRALYVAANLYTFVCNGLLDAEQVARIGGSRAAWLCTELIRTLREEGEGSGRGKARARRRVHYFVAAYADPEMGLLAVCNLWARFRLAQHSPHSTRNDFADEARHVFAPLLDMLGMRVLYEEVRCWLWHLYEPQASRIQEACSRIFEQVQSRLGPAFPEAHLALRPCPGFLQSQHDKDHVASLYPRISAGQQAPPIDVTVLVDDEEACYRALYHIHRLFQPVDNSMVDELHGGRINGARTLQTTANVTVDSQRARVTFYICTHTMEEVNRWGLAAIYARNHLDVQLPNAWWNAAEEGYQQIASAPMGALPETLYVFSPQGQLFRFHRGCTVVDYAYHVHTELADQCQRFYVNDEVAEPTTPLYHLDLVALEHDPRAPGPTQVWLNAAHTSRARNNIERFLKRRGLGIDQGQRIFDQRLRVLEEHYGFNIPEHRISQAMATARRQFRLSRVEELLAEIAAGRIVADRILHPLFAEEVIRQILLPRSTGVRAHQLQLAQCCRARPGDDIVGLPSRRQGEIVKLRVHRADCTRVKPEDEQLPLKWRLQPRLQLMVQVEVTAHNEDGLLGDALAEIYALRPSATLHKVEAVANHGVARLRFNVEVESTETAEQIVNALRDLPERTVVEVRYMRLPPSELEAAMHLSSAGSVNPYTRLPVNEQAMFFGRSQELAQIHEWLRAGVGNIWLLGQRRVGKTSLLLHLKNYYLRDRGFVLAFVDFQLLGEVATSNLFFEVANAVYTELQADPRIGDLGAPLPEVFAHQPPVQLINYLRSIQSRLGASRLILLLDEFSRTTDAYLNGDLRRSFFDEWRGLLQATAPEISFITVFQQMTYNSLSQHAQEEEDDPSWHLMELGERLVLRSLSSQDVQRLIEWPMRNFLEYTPENVARVAHLTGGNPFLIQAFCFKLTSHLARQDRRQVAPADIDAVSQEFMDPTESVFAHFLDMLRGSGGQVARQVAQLTEGEAPVSFATLHAALPNYPADKLRRTLAVLTENDILTQPAEDHWQFSSLLFQQWLALNPT